MAALNWDAFEQLPGSAQSNFEMLCRALVRRQYGQYGNFRALAQQPGVEFDLKMHSTCALGDPGRWYGWQCRWYDLPSGRAIGTTRRKKIVEAITTTEKELPGLSDWVLWTRRPLTKGDQQWFYGLTTHMDLHLWTADDIEANLSGEAEILRGTYFGELILTPDNLTRLHAEAVAPIRRRWSPEVHQMVSGEREIRKLLGETGSWEELPKLAKQLDSESAQIRSEIGDLAGNVAELSIEMVTLARTFAASIAVAYASLSNGDLDLLSQQLASCPPSPNRNLAELPRKLRAHRHPAGLIVTNALAHARQAYTFLDKIGRYLGTRLVAILADAGCGKTQLAAQLTAATNARSAGLLIHGKDLHAGGTLEDLARRVVIETDPIPSMRALVAALDAAGQRAHQRLPIVIDGLNEAEDPRDWKALLASFDQMLQAYPYVLVVCTVRTAFADEALPAAISRLEIRDFGHDTGEAIRKYFQYYRINAIDADLPFDLLKRPLTLNLFCQVTNSKREHDVGVEAIPSSLTALLDGYLKQSAERIAELAPRTRRYYEQDVRMALDEIGLALWEQHARSLDERDLRRRLGDDGRAWNESIIRALEQEGVILRLPGDTPGATRVTGVYDALAGHLIADALLSSIGSAGFEHWAKEPATISALGGDLSEVHPLAMDTFRSLVGLVPRRHHRQQLWQLMDEPLRTRALIEAAELEGAYLDAQTVNGLATLVVKPPSNEERDLFDRLSHTRGAQDHPLNAKFLDGVLRPLNMRERDLRWTEWVRRCGESILADVQQLANRWRRRGERDLADWLRARWIMWLLTSTVREVRDHATLALYWFGCGDPAMLFNLTLSALTINDPYVPERMLAASYGVAMTLHSNHSNREYDEHTLQNFALDLYRQMFDNGAPHSTTHALMRDYARHTIQIALLQNPTSLDAAQRVRIVAPFHDGGIREWETERDRNSDKYRGGNAPIQMDFRNYTIGKLVPDRRNYQFDHDAYQTALGNIFWRIFRLGYSLEAFGEIDKRIASLRWAGRMESTMGHVDRYGKKYSWIAFFELYGLHYDKGLLQAEFSSQEERPTDVDIDPSFPDELDDIQIVTIDWLGNRKRSVSAWIDQGERPDPMPHLIVEELNGVPGPWVLLDGFLRQVDKGAKRSVYAFPRGMLVPKQQSQAIRRLLAKQQLIEFRLPQVPGDCYTFAGEIPWCDTFPKNGKMEFHVPIGQLNKRETDTQIVFYRHGAQLTEDESDAFHEKLQLLLKKKHAKAAVAVREMLNTEGITYRFVIKPGTVKEEVTKKITVLLPVRKNTWEGYHNAVNSGRAVTVPAREIATQFGLSLRLPSWNLYDEDDKLASISIRCSDHLPKSYDLCYLRKDILEQYLERERLELIWVFWGEREIWWSGEEFPDPRTKFTHSRKLFKQIYRYQNGRAVGGQASEYYDIS